MQRLFTTFANGWSGLGLLIQRLVTGTALLHSGIVVFAETTVVATIAPQATGAALAIFIIMGLCWSVDRAHRTVNCPRDPGRLE